ncbi:hypothetical protein DFH07DRAFT_221158 [Mycena maculata]|uniref:Uncharacterized protein n=1 Tax=Mycena maculata TaxID=230809 RepID=A0AAD7MRG2_9AGAR|nr:hypothetical protein DFH07DRAFT_221158 [Mycena maculata]
MGSRKHTRTPRAPLIPPMPKRGSSAVARNESQDAHPPHHELLSPAASTCTEARRQHQRPRGLNIADGNGGGGEGERDSMEEQSARQVRGGIRRGGGLRGTLASPRDIEEARGYRDACCADPLPPMAACSSPAFPREAADSSSAGRDVRSCVPPRRASVEADAQAKKCGGMRTPTRSFATSVSTGSGEGRPWPAESIGEAAMTNTAAPFLSARGDRLRIQRSSTDTYDLRLRVTDAGEENATPALSSGIHAPSRLRAPADSGCTSPRIG